jgi:cardiolipin synthase
MKNKLFLVTKYNKVELLSNGDSYCKKYLENIKNAQMSIHLQTYIFEMDEFGKRVFHELVSAAKRGVQVYLVIDAVGSRTFSIEYENELEKVGIHFLRFNDVQLKWIYQWGRRLHHKVLLIDQTSCIVGGINVSNPYDPGVNFPRLDFAILVEGPITFKLNQYCQMVFKKASNIKIHFKDLHEETVVYPKGVDVGISVNDWVYGHRKITKQYSRLTTDAKNEITIINSYFFPRFKFMRQLVSAVRRGVKVRLILPTFSDWPSYILASEFLYDYFLRNGVEIYQWNKSVLHGKLASIDASWVTVGSYNLNYTSYQQNLEINVNVYSADFARKINADIEEFISSGCEKMDVRTFVQGSSLKIKITRIFYYIVLSLIANFSIGFTFQEDNNKAPPHYNVLRVMASLFFFVLGVLGVLLPGLPGIPFFIISFLLVYRQIVLNKKKS